MHKAFKLGALSAGFLLVGAPAQAAPVDMFSSLNIGIANGNQVGVIAQVPVNVCGNAIAVLGTATAGCKGGASADINPSKPDYHAPVRTFKKRKQTELLGLEGLLGSLSGGGQASKMGGGHGGGSCDVNMHSFGNVGILNGNQVYVPAQVPIDISGNAIGILGEASAWSVGGSSANC